MLADVIKVCEIEWQTDGEEVDLPENVTIDIGELDAFELEDEDQINDAITDHLSDTYGYLVEGFTRMEWVY
jgi:hypothetical protein